MLEKNSKNTFGNKKILNKFEKNSLLHINVLGDATHPIDKSSLHHCSHEFDIALVACWWDPVEGNAAQRAALDGVQMGQGILNRCSKIIICICFNYL